MHLRGLHKQGRLQKRHRKRRKNAALNKIEDQIAGGEKLNNPKFELYTDKADKVRFRLTASNGQIIAVSKDFEAKADALKVIELIVKQAPKAKIKEA